MSITLPDADSEESNGNIPGRQVQNSTAGQQVHDIEIESEDEEENAEDEEGDEDEPDDDEAEAIAQRLSAQLWADINRAQADRAHTQNAPETSTTPAEYDGALAQYNAKTLAALTTMKAVLNYADSDPMAHTTLSTSAIPGFEDRNVLDTLKQFVIGGSIARDLAGPLSQILVILARSEVLFTPLPILPPFLPRAPIKKRKRYVGSNDDAPPKKRHAVSNVQQVLLAQISEAVSVISNALTNNLVPETPFDPSIIASIQLQLNQVFLFAMTSSAVPSSDMSALQEISALIQMLGVLSGVQITPGPLPTSSAEPFLSQLFPVLMSTLQRLGCNPHRMHLFLRILVRPCTHVCSLVVGRHSPNYSVFDSINDRMRNIDLTSANNVPPLSCVIMI